LLKYEEEKEDFVLPERYRPQEKKRSRSGLRDTVPVRDEERDDRNPSASEDTVVVEDGGRGEAAGEGQRGGEAEKEDGNIVTWYGDDDPASAPFFFVGERATS